MNEKPTLSKDLLKMSEDKGRGGFMGDARLENFVGG
jgi:hypothetical protein